MEDPTRTLVDLTAKQSGAMTLKQIIAEIDKLAIDRGWIADAMQKAHPPERDKLISPAAWEVYKESIRSLESKQQRLEHHLAAWVLVNQDLCQLLEQLFVIHAISEDQLDLIRKAVVAAQIDRPITLT